MPEKNNEDTWDGIYHVLFMDRFGEQITRKMRFIPRVGDIVPIFPYEPFPKVKGVMLFPHEYRDFKKYVQTENAVVIFVE